MAKLDPLDIQNPDLKGKNVVYGLHATFNFGEYQRASEAALL